MTMNDHPDHLRPLDDPKLTAYALGELDPAESRAMRQRIIGDDEANAYVRDIRTAAGSLSAALKTDAPVDADVERLAIRRAERSATPKATARRFRFGPVLLAASLFIAITVVAGAIFRDDMRPWVSGNMSDVRGDADTWDPTNTGLEENGRKKVSVFDMFYLGSAEAPAPPRIEASQQVRDASPQTALQIAAQQNARNREADLVIGYTIDDIHGGERHPGHNTETYDAITDNAFVRVADHPLSTFSIDVDTASYSNVRRFLRNRQLPPVGAVRIEEFVNYFSYAYPDPTPEHPVATYVDVAACPWAPTHRLVRVGLQAKRMANHERPASNLVFLLDVSGSMNEPNKLPLVKRAMRMLVDELDERDRVAIVVYAGASGLALSSTPAHQKEAILNAIERLQPSGSTAGAAGITLAYKIAGECFVKGGVNRVILATDGDFNVGVTDRSQLVRMIETNRDTGVFLSILGFGMGNLKDAMMEQLSNAGNGNYAYIDTEAEARKALVEQLAGTLVTVAKDVKVQVEFNPAAVAEYRLIGYENRLLAKEDFNDDKKDAGEVGAGHSVTALYEIVPTNAPGNAAQQDDAVIRQRIERIDGEIQGIRALLQRARMTKEGYDLQVKRIADLEAERAELQRRLAKPAVDPLRYQGERPVNGDVAGRGELMTVKMRYKLPDGDTSTKLEQPVRDADTAWDRASSDFRFAASVAAFGMILRDSPHKGSATLDDVLNWASSAERDRANRDAAADPYRTEFLDLVRSAQSLPPRTR